MSRIKITSFGRVLAQIKWGNTLAHHHHNPLQTMVPAVTPEMQCKNWKACPTGKLRHWGQDEQSTFPPDGRSIKPW